MELSQPPARIIAGERFVVVANRLLRRALFDAETFCVLTSFDPLPFETSSVCRTPNRATREGFLTGGGDSGSFYSEVRFQGRCFQAQEARCCVVFLGRVFWATAPHGSSDAASGEPDDAKAKRAPPCNEARSRKPKHGYWLAAVCRSSGAAARANSTATTLFSRSRCAFNTSSDGIRKSAPRE